MVLAAGAVAPACITSTVSIACVMGCESSPAVTTSPGDCSCDSIALPLYWPSADSVVPPIGRATTSWAAVAAFLTHMSLHGAPTYAPWMSDSADSYIQSPAEFSQAAVKPGITQPPHRRSHLALLLATEQHHQIVAGTQPCIAARHDLAFAATQADESGTQTANARHTPACRPQSLPFPMAVP